ncbi:hypothetical protein E1091_03675 [Micromonospora fluostatini]|uniref:Glycosyl transferase n=1 Tax=Micromonospora fluostatini TaxID=1629071 RepID=A0ABY2DKB1_9ACTN|nr:hypothetical protein E1091_03675 [Micromonospora fluostatini]
MSPAGTPAAFRVTLTATAGFLPYVAAAIASLREHNRSVPVTVFADEPSPVLTRLADLLDVDVEVVPVGPDDLAGARPADAESIRSRIVKITSMARARTAQHLYLDSDTIVRADIGLMATELGPGVDLYSLLNRPVAPTLWGDRRLYFTDPDIDRAGVLELVHRTFGVRLPAAALDEMHCWNSGILLGSAPALRRIADRWLRHYRAMLPMAAAGVMIPRDQLGFWLTMWELRHDLRVEEMPVRWNFMAGHLVPVPVGTGHLDERAYRDAAILHLAQNKSDPWARHLVSGALERSGAAEVLTQAGISAR